MRNFELSALPPDGVSSASASTVTTHADRISRLCPSFSEDAKSCSLDGPVVVCLKKARPHRPSPASRTGGHNRIAIEEFKSFLERHDIPVSEEIKQKVKKGRILVADDDTVLADLIKNVMEDRFKNIEIEIAHDGYEALIKTGKFNPDLLIMDIKMPKIDGLEVCRRLRQDTSLSPGMKIIAITAHSNKYDRETVLASGADEYLIKPIDMQTLQDHVEKLI